MLVTNATAWVISPENVHREVVVVEVEVTETMIVMVDLAEVEKSAISAINLDTLLVIARKITIFVIDAAAVDTLQKTVNRGLRCVVTSATKPVIKRVAAQRVAMILDVFPRQIATIAIRLVTLPVIVQRQEARHALLATSLVT